jgi:hypothetical protein
MNELNQSTPDTAELLRKIDESLQAGRIALDHAETMRRIIRENPSSCDLNTLRYFEKLHTLRPYIEFRGLKFTIHEFTYHFQLPDSEKQKIITVLEEALFTIKIDRRLGESH